ncbi:uncharacterized protein B0I36DRAFT_362446 [Microdochium trichocladiopsis]|uniref:Uncharacterized protein n=1 Tax=Microdochium trichocladiopsis TaxID=1682393 RepID=A0A9P8Y898_9PEZI|nr:uncharacterized protein B0I36DRAFT_362446 [Microdochium trichocladiopsis]KAH7030614.1 hypothetical protein B0I36DRAFT_362446 [Microdochium trichocladiopsis]
MDSPLLWKENYNPFDAVGLQPEHMRPEPPSRIIFKRALEYARLATNPDRLRQRGMHPEELPYGWKQVERAFLYFTQSSEGRPPDADSSRGLLNEAAWQRAFDELVVSDQDGFYLRYWAPERISPRLVLAGGVQVYDVLPCTNIQSPILGATPVSSPRAQPTWDEAHLDSSPPSTRSSSPLYLFSNSIGTGRTQETTPFASEFSATGQAFWKLKADVTGVSPAPAAAYERGSSNALSEAPLVSGHVRTLLERDLADLLYHYSPMSPPPPQEPSSSVGTPTTLPFSTPPGAVVDVSSEHEQQQGTREQHQQNQQDHQQRGYRYDQHFHISEQTRQHRADLKADPDRTFVGFHRKQVAKAGAHTRHGEDYRQAVYRQVDKLRRVQWRI